jgi:RNA polymerase primary sigma factor
VTNHKDIPQPIIDRVLSRLSKLELQVIRLRFGLGGKRPMSLEKVARTLHVRRERVWKIEQKVRKQVAHLRSRTGPDAVD